jgi:hypothetical protein
MTVSNDTSAWFDILLPRVRNLRSYLRDEEIVIRIVSGQYFTAEQVFLCLKAAEILDKP